MPMGEGRCQVRGQEGAISRAWEGVEVKVPMAMGVREGAIYEGEAEMEVGALPSLVVVLDGAETGSCPGGEEEPYDEACEDLPGRHQLRPSRQRVYLVLLFKKS